MPERPAHHRAAHTCLHRAVRDRVALFSNGRVGLAGHVDDLMRDVLGGTYVVDLEAVGDDIPERLKALADVQRVTVVAPGHFRVDATGDIRGSIARVVVQSGGELRSLSIARARLEDVYTHYFKETERAA